MSECLFYCIREDPVTDHWMTEILLNTDMEINELLYRVQDILENGDGTSLVGTNSNRVALASIARSRGAPLTDGSRIKLWMWECEQFDKHREAAGQ